MLFLIRSVFLASSVFLTCIVLMATTWMNRASAQIVDGWQTPEPELLQRLSQNSVSGAQGKSGRFQNLNHWQSLYGPGLDFIITRNGKEVGRYLMTFEGKPERWQVKADMQMKFNLLLLFSYRFRYQATEHWHYHWLTAFESRIDRNGDKERNHMLLSAISQTSDTSSSGNDQRRAESARVLYKVEGLNGTFSLNGPVALSNHYNAAIVGETRLFNSLSGRENQISLQVTGRESVFDGLQQVDATRYEYTGDLKDTWVWYADDGRWLRLRFIAEDGSEIQFNCQRCYGELPRDLRMAKPDETSQAVSMRY